jgi:hypothetical protein
MALYGLYRMATCTGSNENDDRDGFAGRAGRKLYRH